MGVAKETPALFPQGIVDDVVALLSEEDVELRIKVIEALERVPVTSEQRAKANEAVSQITTRSPDLNRAKQRWLGGSPPPLPPSTPAGGPGITDGCRGGADVAEAFLRRGTRLRKNP